MAAVVSLNWRGRGRLGCRLLRDRRMPLPPKLIIPLLALYLLSPVDLVPDFIPVAGYLDDVLVVLLAAWAFRRLSPPGLVALIAGELVEEGYGRDDR